MITISHLQPIVSLLAGILILIIPHLLNYVVAIYLIRAVEPEEWRLARDGLLARLRPSPRAA